MAVALRRTLPPTNSLVVFEAAARHMNFTRAAEELSVTQSAVSRQVQLLEDFLGTTLFQRHARGLQLTREGERLHRAVSMGLEHIANVAADIRRPRGPAELTSFLYHLMRGRLFTPRPGAGRAPRLRPRL